MYPIFRFRLKFVTAALSALSIILLAGSVSFAASNALTTENLNLRTGPGTGNRIIATMPQGSAVNLGECSASWCRVEYGGLSGWASSRYLEAFEQVTRVTKRPPPWRRYGSRYSKPEEVELDFKWHLAAVAQARLETEHDHPYDCYVQTDGLIVCRALR